MKEYDIDYGSLIGGWYIPEEICDNLIELFHTEKIIGLMVQTGGVMKKKKIGKGQQIYNQI